MTYTCQNDASHTYTEEIAATGHNYGTVVTAPTCENGGYTTHTCSVCGHNYVDNHTNALGHTEAIDSAKAPTCTETGLTEGKHCSVCGKTLTAQQTVPATGHTAGNPVVENNVAPECEKAGSYDNVVYCTVCNAEISRNTATVDATGHTAGNPVVENNVAPECEKAGSYDNVAYCTVCNAETSRNTVTVPATGHNGPAADCVNASVCTACGKTLADATGHTIVNAYANSVVTYSCTDCDKTFVLETEGVYFTGNHASGTAIGSYNTLNIGNYIGTGAKYNNGANKVVSENGVLKAVKDVTTTPILDGKTVTNSSESQMQVWLPETKTGFDHFNAGNGSVGVLSFDIKLNLATKYDVFGMLLHNSNGWNPENGIRTNVLNIVPKLDSNNNVVGYNAYVWKNNSTATITLPVQNASGSNWTDWFNVQIFITMDAVADTVTAHYFINGEYLTSGSYTNTVTGDALSCVYLNLNAYNEGCGYYLDNLTFGHTVNGHWTLDGNEHVITTTPCGQADSCSCGWVGDIKGHVLADATCSAGKTCQREGCNYSEGEPVALAHHLAYVNGSYVCSICDYAYEIEIGTFSDGTNYNGMGANAADNGKYYTTNSGKANYPVLNKDGYLEFVRKTDTEGAANTTSAQLQMWLPTWSGVNEFAGFASTNHSIGYLSFSINAYTDTEISMKLVNNTTDNYDVNGDGTAESIRWTDHWAINSPVFTISSVSNGKATVKGFNGMVIATKEIDENNYTGWFDVAIQLILDPDTDTVIANYYIDGEYVGSGSRPLTIYSNSINAVYVTTKNTAAGSGYKLDNVAFGYTGHTHDLVSEFVNNVAMLKCACGSTYILEDYLEWNADGSDSSLKDVPNGNVELSVNADGQYEYIFKPSTNTAPTFTAGTTKNEKLNGWFEYEDTGVPGAQLQIWWPSNDRNGEYNKVTETFADFSCENNAVGVISFKMKTNITRHADRDTALTFSVGKPRNASDWNDGGSWTDDSINIFTIEEYQESGVVLKGGLNGTNINFGAIPVVDGWSEWFEVIIAIELTEDEFMTVYYYINGTYVGSDTRDLANPGNNRTLNPRKIEALQLSGWTYTPNTGIVFDDFVFGYTVEGHNPFDGQYHKLTETTCGEKSSCICGWTGYTVPHDFSNATCAAPVVCADCGAAASYSIPHTYLADCSVDCEVCGTAAPNPATHDNLIPVVNGNSASYVCLDCNKCYLLADPNYHLDGTDYNAVVGTANSINNKYTVNSKGLPNVVDGHYELLTTVDNAGQGELWFPTAAGSHHGKLEGLEAGTGAIGFFSLKLDMWLPHANNTISFLQFADSQTRSISGVNFWTQGALPTALTLTYTTENGKQYATLTGWNGVLLAKREVTDDNPFTGWIDLTIMIEFEGDNVSLTYYADGAYKGTVTKTNNVYTKAIDSAYISVRDLINAGSGIKLDDVVFGYNADGLQDYTPCEHSWVNANCTVAKTCSTCGMTEGYALGHTNVIDSAKAPTCTETGLTEGKHCSVCGTVTTAQQSIPAKGHTNETIPGSAATCTATGLTDGAKCSVCGTVTTAQQSIAAKGHTNETIPGTAATCTATGLTDGAKCSVCGDILTEQTEIPATGHTYTSEVTKPDCENGGYTTHTCACGYSYVDNQVDANGHTESEAVVENKVNASCTKNGSYENVIYCAVCNKQISRETVTEVAKGHVSGAAVEENVVAPTCTADGSYDLVAKCTVCGAETSRKTITTNANGHNYVDGVCDVCGEKDPDAEPEVSNKYYIATIRTSGNYWYMTSNLGTASTSRYTAIDSKLTKLPSQINNPADGYVFVLEKQEDGKYIVYADGVSGNNYLGYTSGNSGTLVAKSSAVKLTMTENSDGTISLHFAASDAERYLALNGTTGNDYFAFYKSGQKQNLTLIPVVKNDCNHANTTILEGTAATCTEPGLTEGEECNTCGATITEQEEIAALGHTTNEGVCGRCGQTIGGSTPPELTETTVLCTFGNITGTQYANETQTFDNNVTVSTQNKGCHFTSQLRIYDSDSNNGWVIISTPGEISNLVVNVGYKKATLNVYGSTDGTTWVLIQAVQTTTTNYINYDVPVSQDLGYKYLKLDASGAQLRIQNLSVTYFA